MMAFGVFYSKQRGSPLSVGIWVVTSALGPGARATACCLLLDQVFTLFGLANHQTPDVQWMFDSLCINSNFQASEQIFLKGCLLN